MNIFKQNHNYPHGAIPYECCPAKSHDGNREGTLVFDHCRYAGEVACALKRYLPEGARSLLPEQIGLLVALHDIGKVSPGFQKKYFPALLGKYAPEWLKKDAETNHAEIGAAAYKKIANVEWEDAEVAAIACHHGKADQSPFFCRDGAEWQKERERLVQALAEAFGETLDPHGTKGRNYRLLAGIMCVADWIASNEDFFPTDGAPIAPERLTAYVAQVLMRVGYLCEPVRSDCAFGDLFQQGGVRFTPRGEQAALIDIVRKPGVYVMEATMGAGKTEAALYAAYKMIASGHNNGIYFALPTRLTSDRIYHRMQEFLDRSTQDNRPVRLSHGRAWLEGYQLGGSETHGELPSWFAPSKRGLLYPYAVGTIDQALLAAMNVRHSFVRLFGLAGKVVILDEVHSYDMYTGSLVETLVRELRNVGCTVIILSATLTRQKRDRLLGCETPADAPYPFVCGNVDGRLIQPPQPRTDAAEKRVALKCIDGAAKVVLDALTQARRGCNVLCVANTVRQAQRWYLLLKGEMNGDGDRELRIGLLHSRFPDFRRGTIEDAWMDALGKDSDHRPHGSILISTQIVEQSVDIDADYLITEPAPIDMLFQRTGRLWRHERGNRPVETPTCVLAFDGGCPNLNDFTEESFESGIGKGSCCVYAPYVLLQTLRALEGRNELSIPHDMRSLLEAVYADRDEMADSAAEKFKTDIQETKRNMELHALAAGASVTSLPAQDDSEDVPPTRYGSRKNVSLLLVKSFDGGVGHGYVELKLMDGTVVRVSASQPDFAVTKALYANVVSVPMSKALAEVPRGEEQKLLAQHFHAGEMPLICEVGDNGELVSALKGEPVGVYYRYDLGVFDERLSDATGKTNVVQENGPFELGEVDW